MISPRFAIFAVLTGLASGCRSTESPAAGPPPAPSSQPDAAGPSCRGRSIVLTRHTEKENDGTDPSLSEAGRARAERLAGMFAQSVVTRLVASEYKRTQETLAPIAKRTLLTVEVRKAAEVKALAEELGRGEDGAFVVVAGHSNTIPYLLRVLGGGSSVGNDVTIPDNEYGRVFVLAFGCDEKAPPTLTERTSD